MSRIVVKNLPKKITPEKLKDLFSSKGQITDLQLKYTKTGAFRQFAFIGYKTNNEAEEAREFFNNTFIQTSKIKIEICSNLMERSKPAWQKPTQSIKRKQTFPEESPIDDKKAKLLADSEFKSFLDVHKDRTSNPTWGDVTSDFQKPELEAKPVKVKVSDDTQARASEQKVYDNEYTVKIRNLPFSCKKKHIKDFFRPLKAKSIRIPPKCKGFAFVQFKSEKEMKQALNKNKGFLEKHQVDVIKYENREKKSVNSFVNSAKYPEKGMEENLELLAETGRIYMRNLPFNCTESEIEELFSKYGPIAETTLPIDFLTKKCQGYAFVSFVFAEHAVKAFTELDGTVFQGRMLHLIPGKPKKETKPDVDDKNFKKKKELNMKASSGSSHNWNILFVAPNAVADIISDKYNIEKSQLLSGDSKESVAVRMALAETQVIIDTRKFLVDQGVELDAFSQPAAERSKTIIIVKNLPANTAAKELYELFSKHGTISKVVLPPSGLVALIEFQEPAEAKAAFSRLAYSRFRYLPLYLEWAPIDALKPGHIPKLQDEMVHSSNLPNDEQNIKNEDVKQEKSDESSEEDDPEPDATVFVKNINFATTEESFKRHFENCGSIHSATISMKKDIKTGELLSMGFGFVQFKQRKSAIAAIQNLQSSMLDEHSLELKFSNRASAPVAPLKRKKYEFKKQRTSKILVRNIPFEASQKEVRDLFKEFGELKFVRLPKKTGGAEHRGFGFVEYETRSDAKRAFETLCHSTHLFGRRLVLEWANPESEDVNELRKKTVKDFLPQSQHSVSKRKLNEDIALLASRKS